MNQRCGAAPILVGRICQKKSRRTLGFDRSVKETSGVAALGIGFRKVSEGKQICRKENAGERLSVTRRLGKTMIEAASSSAGDVSDDAVHHLAALFVGVEI